MKVLITGGSGYKGSVLIPELLKCGHEIVSIDNEWFGHNLPKHNKLKTIKTDIRELGKYKNELQNTDCIIHLANIANDPAVDLSPTLSWEVNVLASQQIADAAKRNGVRQIIYASSGSVYGIKSEERVTEDLSLVPISVYNKTKMVAERVFLSYSNHMQIHCIRPATVCGISPRMRLDVSVNLLTYMALKNNRITVFGGKQTRPNIHIKDMVNVYKHFLDNPKIESGCYNAGFENITILDIAKSVAQRTNAELVITESNDPRSYRQCSDKLLSTGFSPNYNVETAIDEIIYEFKNNQLIDNDMCYTVKWMKTLGLEKY